MRGEETSVVTCPNGHDVELYWYQSGRGGEPIPPTETVSPFNGLLWLVGRPCPRCGLYATLAITEQVIAATG